MVPRGYNAWIGPNGVIHYCGCHVTWAQEYLEDKYGFEKAFNLTKNHASNSSYLHSIGWVRLLTWVFGKTRACGDCWNPRILDDTVDPSLSKQQKATLKEWCFDHNYDYDNLFL